MLQRSDGLNKVRMLLSNKLNGIMCVGYNSENTHHLNCTLFQHYMHPNLFSFRHSLKECSFDYGHHLNPSHEREEHMTAPSCKYSALDEGVLGFGTGGVTGES